VQLQPFQEQSEFSEQDAKTIFARNIIKIDIKRIFFRNFMN